jgi:hypothetical protein
MAGSIAVSGATPLRATAVLGSCPAEGSVTELAFSCSSRAKGGMG